MGGPSYTSVLFEQVLGDLRGLWEYFGYIFFLRCFGGVLGRLGFVFIWSLAGSWSFCRHLPSILQISSLNI